MLYTLVCTCDSDALFLAWTDRIPLELGTGTHPAFQWGPCDPTIVEDPSISCSFFEIPLDYHDRSAGTGRIAVAKVNATAERFGTLFINPGGPGESGLAALDSLGSTASSLAGGHYDIVSWDPRGVGPLTIPGDIQCFNSVEEYNTFWNGTIELAGIEMTGNFTNPQDIEALLSQAPIMQKKYEELGERCLQQPSGRYLEYVGTAATVRDMVAMADVLDGPTAQINFAGLSYGTILGAWFVNMFPERVGRVILDGVVDPTFLATEETTAFFPKQLVDADKVYDALITACALSGPAGCAATAEGQTPADVNANVQALLQRAHDAARKNSSVPVTSADIRKQLFAAVYFPAEWATFVNMSYPEAVAAVDAESSGSAGTRAAARRSHRKRQANDSKTYGGPAIACSDSVDRRGTKMIDVFKGIISSSRTGSHFFTSVWPNLFNYCPFWPVRAVERYQGPFNRKLANKVLVLSNTYDPVTPLADARALAKLLGDSGILVLLDGFGHTTSEPSQCLLEIVSAYFANGTLPEGNRTVCEVDADYEVFTGVNTEAILAALQYQ
ncbi:alpha/beta-hydrolase [Cubamyces lactineus]|nr:alpha/beta-hydrolase [Cubamyces lactineus]